MAFVTSEEEEAKRLEIVCLQIADGRTMSAIAEEIGISKGSLSGWIAAKAERSARVRSAREMAAVHWEEEGEHVIRAAGNGFELAKAKELAHHYRWRASAIAPDYSTKETRKHEVGESITAMERRIVDPAKKV
jgi:transposase-like protein